MPSVKISELSSGSAISDGDLFVTVQGATTYKVTGSQLKTYAAAGGGTTTNAVTFANTGGAASGTTFDGSAARTIDYSTVGAPKADGTGASGTWGISVSGNAATVTNGVYTTRQIIAGTGLSGGGDFSADRTLALANTAVTAGSYTNANITVDAQGRITSAANGSGGGGGTTTNAVTFTNTGGAAAGTTFDGSVARTIDYSTLGAPSITGTNATGTWSIDILGQAGTVANGVYTTGSYSNPSWITSIAWSKVSTTPTTLSGYGITDAAASATTISAGTGLSGGGDLTANRTISLANTAVTAGSYTSANITVDAQGRITAASNGTGGGGGGGTNLDGGLPDSSYLAVDPIDGGTP